MTVADLTNARLVEIEHIAENARRSAQERLDEIGIVLSRDTDIRYIAAAISNANVQAIPNLSINGRRLAGNLEQGLSGLAINYEAYDPYVRQRFSICHELGHFFLHVFLLHGQGVHGDAPDADEDEDNIFEHEWELEADAFAAAFLIPCSELRADIERFGPCFSYLALRYEVAGATMRRRLRTVEKLPE